MKCKSLVGMTLLLLSGSAFAGEQNIASVEVRPSIDYALDFSCANPTPATALEVEELLGVNDRAQTHQLGNNLMAAVGEACRAGVANIVVARRGAKGGALTWRPAREYEASVALN